jgi:hypothetical protein
VSESEERVSESEGAEGEESEREYGYPQIVKEWNFHIQLSNEMQFQCVHTQETCAARSIAGKYENILTNISYLNKH